MQRLSPSLCKASRSPPSYITVTKTLNLIHSLLILLPTPSTPLSHSFGKLKLLIFDDTLHSLLKTCEVTCEVNTDMQLPLSICDEIKHLMKTRGKLYVVISFKFQTSMTGMTSRPTTLLQQIESTQEEDPVM